eukprot:3013941-Rhodomonas_salina.1
MMMPVSDTIGKGASGPEKRSSSGSSVLVALHGGARKDVHKVPAALGAKLLECHCHRLSSLGGEDPLASYGIRVWPGALTEASGQSCQRGT